MFVEIKNIRQNEGEPFRRIFNSMDFYLIVWFTEDEPITYQLFYHYELDEYCIHWEKETGISFHLVDSGEDRPNRHKMAAVLVEKKSAGVEGLADKFKEVSPGLKNGLGTKILRTLLTL